MKPTSAQREKEAWKRCRRQDRCLRVPRTEGEGLGEYCSGYFCRESYDRDGEGDEERLHRIHRQVAVIRFSHVLWL